MAYGDDFRRVIGNVFCRRCSRKLEDYSKPWGNYGVAVSGRVDFIALKATLGFEGVAPFSRMTARTSPIAHAATGLVGTSRIHPLSSLLRSKSVREGTPRIDVFIRQRSDRRFGAITGPKRELGASVVDDEGLGAPS